MGLREFATKKNIGHNYPERIGSRPGRRKREQFETTPTSRASARQPSTGKLWRGRGPEQMSRGSAEVHGEVARRISSEILAPEQLPRVRSYGQNPKRYDVEFGYTEGREGKFISVADADAASDSPGSSVHRRNMEEGAIIRKGTRQTKADLRAGSEDTKDKYRRNVRGEGLLRGLQNTNAEITSLTGSTAGSQDQNRLQQLVRRKGVLKNLGRQAGLMGVSQAAGAAVTPFATWDAIKGVVSKDPNRELKAMEHFMGLPEYSTGRKKVGTERYNPARPGRGGSI